MKRLSDEELTEHVKYEYRHASGITARMMARELISARRVIAAARNALECYDKHVHDETLMHPDKAMNGLDAALQSFDALVSDGGEGE